MNNFLAKLVTILTIVLLTKNVQGQSTSSNCHHNGIVAGFYNGVFNTPQNAQDSLAKLKASGP